MDRMGRMKAGDGMEWGIKNKRDSRKLIGVHGRNVGT
jgi:hypothetical protein